MKSSIKSKEKYINDLRKIVSIRSLTSDQPANREVIDFVESQIDRRAYIKRIVNDGVTIFIASNKKTPKPDICLLAHTDVVAGNDEQFTVRIKNGKAYGRGVSDMKFSIPIGYQLLNYVIASNLNTSFALVLTTDEETGGFKGAKYLVDKIGYKPKALIVPDGGDNLEFVYKAKGVCILEISSQGKPAHSSRIWEGKNAIEPIIKLCDEAIRKYGKNNLTESFRTTMNIGTIHGGKSANQVCGSASVTLDFRFPESKTHKGIYREVASMAQRIDKNLRVATISTGDPTYTDRNDKIVRRFIKSFESAYKRVITIKPTYGASDARHFSKLRIPVLMIKPVGGDIHGDAECVDINSCLTFYEALKTFLEHWR